MVDVLVVGGGIGGLSATIALAREGHRVTLVERAATFEAVGAGIVLAPNAVHVLAALGVGLAGRGQALTRTEVRTAGGHLLNALDLTAPTARLGPTYALARPALHEALVRALPAGAEVVRGRAVDAVEERADRVVARWGGGEHSFDLVIGADGLHSEVRAAVIGPRRLRYSGTTCWRGTVETSAGDVAVETWGRDTRVGIVPIGPGRSYYFLVLTAPRRAPQPPWPHGFRAAFGHFHGAAGELLAALPGPPPLHHDLLELDRPVWGRPRVLLLGDAAHAMTPNQGQGAAMAIEDAAALALALRPGIDGALERYAATRNRRVRRVQLTSRRIGTVAHWRNPAATRIRDGALRLAPAAAGLRALDALVRPGLDLAEAAAERNRDAG